MFTFTARIIATAALTLLLALPMGASAANESDFDHASTGFPLTGGHRSVACESCHRSGIFRGTPRQCSTCHTQSELGGGALKNATHIPSTNACEDCHTITAWTPVRRVDHTAVIGNCESCHNGSRAATKSATHIRTTLPCADCHRTSSWFPARYNHASAAPGTCETCHVAGGTASTSRPATNHAPGTTAGTASCDECHNTRAWTPARYNHASAQPGQCATCHGVTATGKGTGHVTTSDSCDSCHITRRWTPATMHSNASFGRCATCHNGTTASGMNGGHFPTTASCGYCHRMPSSSNPTPGWKGGKMDHSSVAPNTCNTCHAGGYTNVTQRPTDTLHSKFTTLSCDWCHTTRAWLPAGFDHSGVAPGTCGDCHDGAGAIATTKPANHFTTSLSCDACHTTRGWLPAGFAHSSPNYPNHGRTIACNSCHSGSPQTAANAWDKYPQYKPSCAGCHYDKYLKKHKAKDIQNMMNCLVGCHEHSMSKW